MAAGPLLHSAACTARWWCSAKHTLVAQTPAPTGGVESRRTSCSISFLTSCCSRHAWMAREVDAGCKSSECGKRILCVRARTNTHSPTQAPGVSGSSAQGTKPSRRTHWSLVLVRCAWLLRLCISNTGMPARLKASAYTWVWRAVGKKAMICRHRSEVQEPHSGLWSTVRSSLCCAPAESDLPAPLDTRHAHEKE